ncbi:MAG: hypothetical protein V8T37_01985 [Streptococcus sp.]
MKKSIFRWSAAVLVAASLGLALSGCGAKDKKTASSSAKASTSKVEKTAKTNSKKECSIFLSGKRCSLLSSTQASSSTATKDSGKTENASTTTQAPVPAELVGTWVGSSPQADSIKMTVDANGDVTTVVSFKNDSEPTRTATYTARAVQATGNIYYWNVEGFDGADALLPGITGLGGANFRFEPGFVLEEGHYTPIVFTTDLNTEFDYTKYNDFRFSLTKEQ